MKLLKNIALFLLVVSTGFSGLSQQKDFQIWSGAAISKEFNKKLTLGAELQSRFENNASQIGTYFTEFSAKYVFADWYKPGVNYRLTRWGEGFGANQRFDIDNTLRFKAKDERFYIRFRWQREFYRGVLAEDDLRFRIKYAHKFSKKFRMSLASEHFYTWEYDEGFANWGRQRYTAGMEYEFAKKNSFELFYRFQNDLNQANPDNEFIIGIGYELELD